MKRHKTLPADTTLSDLQFHVMQVLWQHGEASASDVQADLKNADRDLALTTVSTLLSRLARRDLAKTRKQGRQVFYSANVSERDVKRGMVSGLMGTLFAGDPRALVTHLVNERELGPGDLDMLRRLLDEKDNR